MKELYLYHHLGLGDHIICNALVRHYAKLHDKIYLFVKKHNLTSVSFMYRDLTNIEFIVGDDNYVVNYLTTHNIENILMIGFSELFKKGNKFDESFYSQVNIEFDKRWSDFYVDRDLEQEKKLFKKYGLTDGEKYAFLHDDVTRSYNINEKYVTPGLKIIRPIREYTDNIFEYCYILENATELHFMDSSFKLLFDSLEDKKQIAFHHAYCKRPDENKFQYVSSSNKDFTYLTER